MDGMAAQATRGKSAATGDRSTGGPLKPGFGLSGPDFEPELSPHAVRTRTISPPVPCISTSEVLFEGGPMGSAKEERKERHERFLLRRFLEHQGISPHITKLRPPDPDFLIDIEGRKVGVELTELFIRSEESGTQPQATKKPLLQALESRTDRIVCLARRLYFDDGDSLPVRASILFPRQVTLDKKKGDQIARLIADKIQSMNLRNSQVVNWRAYQDEEEEDPLSDRVHFIHALGVNELRLARWTVARAGSPAPLTPRHLQERIDDKVTKNQRLQEECGRSLAAIGC